MRYIISKHSPRKIYFKPPPIETLKPAGVKPPKFYDPKKPIVVGRTGKIGYMQNSIIVPFQ